MQEDPDLTPQNAASFVSTLQKNEYVFIRFFLISNRYSSYPKSASEGYHNLPRLGRRARTRQAQAAGNQDDFRYGNHHVYTVLLQATQVVIPQEPADFIQTRTENHSTILVISSLEQFGHN